METRIKEIEQSILHQVYDCLDDFCQDLFFDDGIEDYFSPSHCIIRLSLDDYNFLCEVKNAKK